MMAADTMEALGIPRGGYVVKVNNRKLLDGMLEAIGLAGEQHSARRLTVLRALDKHDRLKWEGVEQLLGPGRRDESGDFTRGADLSRDQIRPLFLLFSTTPSGTLQPTVQAGEPVVEFIFDEKGEPVDRGAPDNFETLKFMRSNLSINPTFLDGVAELEQIAEFVAASGYGPDRIRLDPSVVRGLEYYTGPVYEIELTFETKDEKGRPVRFGSVGGGGRYDGLVSRFRGEPVPATGFSIGVSRLQSALTYLKKLDGKPAPGPVVVTVFDQDRIADYQRMVQSLRSANIRAELYLGSGKFGPQMKYADKRNAPCVVIQGGDEKAKGEVQIKDLVLGATLTATKDRDEYLKKQAEAQFAVPEDKLVEAVRTVLARHGLG